MSVERKLQEMDLEVSSLSAPVANYVSTAWTGNLLHVAGHIPSMPDESILHRGKVGREVTEDQDYEIA